MRWQHQGWGGGKGGPTFVPISHNHCLMYYLGLGSASRRVPREAAAPTASVASERRKHVDMIFRGSFSAGISSWKSLRGFFAEISSRKLVGGISSRVFVFAESFSRKFLRWFSFAESYPRTCFRGSQRVEEDGTAHALRA